MLLAGYERCPCLVIAYPLFGSLQITVADRERIVHEAIVKFAFSVPVGAAGDVRLDGIKDRFRMLMQLNQYVIETSVPVIV